MTPLAALHLSTPLLLDVVNFHHTVHMVAR